MGKATRSRPAETGLVAIAQERCKGCGICVAACPVEVLRLTEGFNAHGYHPAEYSGSGCTGCGICFYACPEPGAVTVYTRVKEKTPLGAVEARR
jgi:NAD-dependent dihydropyrimidine dehydrogenase PreA subunit